MMKFYYIIQYVVEHSKTSQHVRTALMLGYA